MLVSNNVTRPFWIAFASPFLFVECKNWSKHVGAKELRDFEMKLRNHGTLARGGMFVAAGACRPTSPKSYAVVGEIST